MRHRSKKMEAMYRERRKLVALLLQEFPHCQACVPFAVYDNQAPAPVHLSEDVHELIRRSQGGSILERENLITVCRKCHTRIGENPALAIEVGVALPSWATQEMKIAAAEKRYM